MAVTLKDVARAAGVSHTTVSYVLTNRKGVLISPGTRQRVLAAAAGLNYRHNAYASRLRRGKSGLVGLLTSTLGSPISLAKILAVDEALRARGYRMTLGNTNGMDGREVQLVHEFESTLVEGIVLFIDERLEETMAALAGLQERGAAVLSLEPIENLTGDVVSVDRAYGASLATRHLLTLGRRRVAFLLQGSAEDEVIRARLRGYDQAHHDLGVPLPEDLVRLRSYPGCNGYQAGHAAARDLLAEGAAFDALFCINDQVAIGAMSAVREQGLQVPGDIAIVGFDGLPEGEFAQVPLTTVAQPTGALGDKAAEWLFERLSGSYAGEPRTLLLPPALLVRASCGARGQGPPRARRTR